MNHRAEQRRQAHHTLVTTGVPADRLSVDVLHTSKTCSSMSGVP